jgi:hypothetical protein
MRPLHLKIAATGLLAACTILITRRAAEPELFSPEKAETAPRVVEKKKFNPVASERETAALDPMTISRSIGGVLPQGNFGRPAAKGRHFASTSPAINSDDEYKVGTQERSALPAPVVDSADVGGQIGIQLGQDVRLPAALMNQSGNDLLIDERSDSTKVTAAVEQIANSFYRELAGLALAPATAEDVPVDPQHELSESTDDGNTVVIATGSQVEEARERADEIYRVLYGDDAYNRYSIGSAVEVRLPADIVESTK